MKHWHRCRRWRRLGIACPLDGFQDHELVRELDSEDPRPPPPPPLAGPLPPPDDRDDEEEEPVREELPPEQMKKRLELLLAKTPDPDKVVERLDRADPVDPVGKRVPPKPPPGAQAPGPKPPPPVEVRGAPADRLGDLVATELANGMAAERPFPRRGGQFRPRFQGKAGAAADRPEERELLAERSEVALTDQLMIEARAPERRPRAPRPRSQPTPAPRVPSRKGRGLKAPSGGRGGGGGFHFRFLDRLKGLRVR